MSDQLGFLAIQKMKTLGIDFHETSKGVGLVLTTNGDLEIGVPGSKLLTQEEAKEAIIEFLKK